MRADEPRASDRTSGGASAAAGAPPAGISNGAIAIEAVGITKAYGATLALDRVDFQAIAGKVNVLLGENGAGKSTLMKILAGEVIPDSGQLLCNGVAVRLRSPRDARDHGIALIHQELSLFPALTVADNIFAGQEHGRLGLVNSRRHVERAQDILARLDPRIDPTSLVSTLAVGQQQVVEIAKALASDARVVIMDEPTSALSNTEVDALFRIVRDLTARGVAVVYISHRMDEIFRIGDILVVFRDGRRVASATASDADMSWITENMLGSKERAALQYMTTARSAVSNGDARAAMRMEHLSLASAETERMLLDDISFDLRVGEILGVYGLLGAGKTELSESIAGLRPDAVGVCRVGGKEIANRPRARLEAGIAFVPEDRQRQAVVPTGSVSDNVTLSSLGEVATAGIVSIAREERAVARMVSQLSIRVRSGKQPIHSLSGGNQQKAIIARALLRRPRVLVLDEPTRGIDVGAKSEIFRIMRALADDGLAVVFASCELPEIMAVSDRILVFSRGRACALFNAREVGEADVTKASANDALR
jgi:ABC-type sugar transport system ATPase subunit